MKAPMAIRIRSKRLAPEALEDVLTCELPQNDDIRLEVRRTRALETAVLVAITGSVGTAMSALISGLLKIAAQKGEAKIVLQGPSGARVEVPADTPVDELPDYVKLANELGIDEITI